MPNSKFRDDITVIGMPLTEICNARVHRSAPAPAVQEHHLRRRAVGAARDRPDGDREADRRAVQGQGEAARAEHAGAARWAATTRSDTRLPARHHGSSAPTRSATGSSSTATARRRSAAVYGGATVCAWYPITPSSSLAEAFASHCRKFRVDPDDRQEPLRDRAGRGRARLDRHGDRRGLERRALVHCTSGPGISLMTGVHRPRLFRRDSGGAVRRAARRPVDGHADAHAAVRHPRLRLCVARRHQARAAVPGGPDANASRLARRRSISPTGCRRRCSSCSISTSA